MRRRLTASLLLSVLGAAALAGCGIPDPYAAKPANGDVHEPRRRSSSRTRTPLPSAAATIPRRRRAAASRVAPPQLGPRPRRRSSGTPACTSTGPQRRVVARPA